MWYRRQPVHTPGIAQYCTKAAQYAQSVLVSQTRCTSIASTAHFTQHHLMLSPRECQCTV